VLLKREGYLINHKKLFWLYREEKLAVRHRGGRKRAIGTRAPMMVPMAPNELVARLRVGSAHRRPPLPHPDRGRILHPRVPGAGGRHLALRRPRGAGTGRLMSERGKPKMVVSDNGSELTSNAILTSPDHTRVD
jgi:putative transposase